MSKKEQLSKKSIKKEINKKKFGQFFTSKNPFNHKLFKEWLSKFSDDECWLEPFAGSNNLIDMLEQTLNKKIKFKSYDINPKNINVEKLDTIKQFPKDFKIGITNPPYLAKNSAKRNKIENINFENYDDLYKVCISKCLDNLEYLAAIIPESFITSGLFQDRLYGVISLTCKMFNDTNFPVCLALWVKNNTDDFKVYSGNRYIGYYKKIIKKLNINEKNNDLLKCKFNDKNGNIGLIAVDNTTSDSIEFISGELISEKDIKISSRSKTRISIDNTLNINITKLIKMSNIILKDIRNKSNDIILTSFKGLRKDKKYRRRLDWKIAKHILNKAYIEISK